MKDKTKLSTKQLLKRNAILKAAIEEFSHKGYHKAKISTIADLANVATGTVYLYFQSKENLLVSAFNGFTKTMLEDMKNKIADENSTLERLIKLFDLHVGVFTKHPEVARFLAIELRQSPDFYENYPLHNPFLEYLTFIEKLIIDAIKEGSIREVDPKALTYIIFGTMDFLLTEWSTKDNPFPLQKAKDIVVDIIYNGIRKG
ncbi:MAG: TetR/AcrR family transcriptional regulator [Candidatus Cloacimonetes bacterium]|nr:TetR/AcrR family transcriptional regulator [Candidatus Cloacimonadota bacterium]